MSPRGTIAGSISAVITSARLRSANRSLQEGWRKLMRQAPTIHYFHGVADPWSHLAVQCLPALAERYGVVLVPHLVGPPDKAAAPDPERLAGWGLRDARQLAAAHGLAFPADAVAPSAQAIAAVEAALAGLHDPCAFAERAVLLGTALWSGQPVGPAARKPVSALAAGNAALHRAGHYLPAVFAFEGESYWGVDRLPHLEARLAARRTGPPLLRQLEASDTSCDCKGAELHIYLSFRSPYSYLAAARVRRLAQRHNARLVLRPLLPMVMRGLPVPRAKRMYIVRDTMREAERLGLPFGRICDPLGPGVERGLAVLHRATAQGLGPVFAESFLAGVFAEAIDSASDSGLLLLARRAGLGEADVRAALQEESWRAEAEANREALLALGLWGVPSFQVGSLPAQWGQDRLWAVERDLRSLGAGQP